MLHTTKPADYISAERLTDPSNCPDCGAHSVMSVGVIHLGHYLYNGQVRRDSSGHALIGATCHGNRRTSWQSVNRRLRHPRRTATRATSTASSIETRPPCGKRGDGRMASPCRRTQRTSPRAATRAAPPRFARRATSTATSFGNPGATRAAIPPSATPGTVPVPRRLSGEPHRRPRIATTLALAASGLIWSGQPSSERDELP